MSQTNYQTSMTMGRKMIHWELCKRLNFDDTEKFDRKREESVVENHTHKILWNIEIEIGHPIQTRRLELLLKKKNNLSTSGPAVKVRESKKTKNKKQKQQKTKTKHKQKTKTKTQNKIREILRSF